jgi:hypothetical protein
MTLTKPVIISFASLLFCIAVLTYFVVQSYHLIPHDYSNSYFGAYFYLKGDFNSSVFDPYTFNKKIFDEGFHNIFASYSPNPPFTALFFVPFALLPLGVSKLVFNIISSVLFIISIYRLCKHLEISITFIYLLIPLTFFVPLRNEILFGQTYFLILFLITEGYLAYFNNKKALATILWAVSILIKVFPLIIIIFLVLKKDWRASCYLVVTCSLLLLVSVSLQGLDVWVDFLTTILPRSGRGEITSAYMTNYQSAHMFLKYAFLQNDDLNPSPLIKSSLLFHGLEILFKGIVLGICSSIIIQRKDLLAFGLLIFGAMLISPYGSTYANLLLFFIFIVSFKAYKTKQTVLIVFLLFMISNFPIGLLNSLPETLQFPRLLFYCALLSTLFFYSEAKFNLYLTTGFTALFVLTQISQPLKLKDESKLLFKDDKQSLIFDYGLRGNQIVYTFWSDHGPTEFLTNMKGKNITTDSVKLIDNQIYYKGRQITQGNDSKLKPSILDGHSIMYLSDKDRGLGFYNIRILKIDERI